MILLPELDYAETAKALGWILFIAFGAWRAYKSLSKERKDVRPSSLDDRMRVKYLEGEVSRLKGEVEEAQKDANILGQAMLRIERLDERVKKIEGDDDCEKMSHSRKR